jgi:oligopeptide transport system substrate-binding protein
MLHHPLAHWSVTRAAALLALTLVFLLGGCRRGETPADRAMREGILLLGNGTEPEDLDPHITTGMPEYRITAALFEGLTSYAAKDLAIEGGVAARWEISDDGLVYTFHLRPEARWSNGDPVTAHDFAYGWRRVLSPALGNRYTYLYDPVRGATAFHAGQIPWEDVGIKALDDHTFRVGLDHPVPYLLGLLTHNTFYPVHRATIERHGRMDQRGTPWTQPGNLVSNGPFQLHHWRNASLIEVRPNPHYWDRGAVKLNAIRVFPIESADTEERAFRNGQLHATNTIPRHLLPRLRERQAPELRLAPFLGVYYYEFNATRPPLDDPRVRRALSLAIDRTLLVERVTRGNEEPAYSFLHPGTLGGRPAPRFQADIDEARRLLAEAGFPGGEGFPRLDILYNTLESHRILAEALQQMWRVNLGINLRLTNQEWQVYLRNRRAGQFDIARAGWVASYHDGTVFTNLMMSDSGNNNSGWSDPAYDAVAMQVRRETDPERRLALFHQLGAMLNEAMPVMPLYYYTSANLVDPRVRGWYDTLLDIHPLKSVHFATE